MATRRGHIQPLLLAAILAAGAGVAWLAAMAIFAGTVAAIFPDRPEIRERLEVSIDGTPFIILPQTVKDLNLNLDGTRFQGPSTSNAFVLQSQNKQIRNFFSRWQRLYYFGGETVSWYFVHDGAIHGRGYFVGYDVETKLPVEYIGRNGFCSERPAGEEQFPVDGCKIDSYRVLASNWSFEWLGAVDIRWGRRFFLLSDDGLVAIDLDGRTAKLLWKAPDLVSAVVTDKDTTAAMKRFLQFQTTQLQHSYSAPMLLVRTPDRVLGLDFDGRELECHVIPPELRDDRLEWHRLSDGRVLVRRSPHDNELFWIDAAGKIVRHEKVNLQVKREFHRPWPN